MLFNSLAFLAFFPIVTALYFLVPHKYRWMLLLAASMYFYMYFKPIYILLVLYVVLVNFFAGKYIYKFKDSPAKKVILTVSIVLNLAVLVFFKYFNFLNFNITAMLDMLSFTNPIPALEIFLPLGISFYTFQAMAYTIDISRGIQEPEKNIGIFATFLMFYPQLVAGPIERAGHLLGQFREKHVYDYPRLVSGLRLMLWGLFKKVAIADRLGIFVKEIYVNMDQYSGLVLFIAAIFFAYQLYCDFSGYSDIAIGAARVMGFDLMLNFNRPYSARSVTDFWRRWHISLSTWLYDYVYNPVSFNRRYWGKAGIVYALMVTFFVSGLWHGANWNFVVFGLLHGVALSVEFLLKKKRKNWSKKFGFYYDILSNMATFSYFTFSVIFFRANSLGQALNFLKKLFDFSAYDFGQLMHLDVAFLYNVAVGIPLILLLVIFEKAELNEKLVSIFNKKRALRFALYTFALIQIGLFGVFLNQNDFIYFQF